MPPAFTPVFVCDCRESVAQCAAQVVLDAAGRALARSGRFTMIASPAALTQRALGRLGGSNLAWRDVHLFASDDHGGAIPSGDGADATLPIPRANLHGVPARGRDPGAAAAAYERRLRAWFGVTGGELPRFDLALLELHEDGRVAGLAPHSSGVDETVRLVAASYGSPFGRPLDHHPGDHPFDRSLDGPCVTLTAPLINQAREIVLLAAGANAAGALASALGADPRPQAAPARLFVRRTGSVHVLVDEAAALHIPAERRMRPREATGLASGAPLAAP